MKRCSRPGCGRNEDKDNPVDWFVINMNGVAEMMRRPLCHPCRVEAMTLIRNFLGL